MEHEFCGERDCEICFPRRTTVALHPEIVDLIIDLGITTDTLRSYLRHSKTKGFELPPMAPGEFEILTSALWHIKSQLQYVENNI